MIVECCCCRTTYSKKPTEKKDIKPAPDDRLVYGCRKCQKGNWQSHKGLDKYYLLEDVRVY